MSKENSLNGYSLSRSWFDFAFENYDKVSPNHTAMIMWFVELNNRLGWPKSFASPASQTMTAIGIKSYNTYKKTFDELENWGFFKVITASKNQWNACVIALSKFDKAQYKALDKALAKHVTKHMKSTQQSTVQSTDSINKPINHKPNKPQTIKTYTKSLEELKKIASDSFEKNNCNFGNDFKHVWLEILDQPKWRKKPQSAVDKSLKSLMKYNEDFAILLVESAISGNYQGVTFSDTDIKYQNFLKQKNNGNSENRQSRVDEVAKLGELTKQIIANGN